MRYGASRWPVRRIRALDIRLGHSTGEGRLQNAKERGEVPRERRTGAFHTGAGREYAAPPRMPVKGAHRNAGPIRMTQHRNPFEIELDKNEANYVSLSPLSFLRRTASV